MRHPSRHPRPRVRLALAVLASTGLAGVAPVQAAVPSAVGRAAARPAPSPACAGALVPVGTSVDTPYGGALGPGDASGPGAVYLAASERQADGSGRVVLRQGPATGPLARTPLPLVDPASVASVASVVAVDPGHAWLAGSGSAPDGTSTPAVWRASGPTVVLVPVPADLLPSGADRATFVDGSSDTDVWLGIGADATATTSLLHWDGSTWSAVPGGLSSNGLGLALTAPGTVVAVDVSPTDGREHWYATSGTSWREVTGPDAGAAAPGSAGLVPGHGRPLAVWSTGSGERRAAQWRGGAWQALTPALPSPDVAQGGISYAVAADGSVWSLFSETLPGLRRVVPRSLAVLDGSTWVRSATLDDPAVGGDVRRTSLVPLDLTGTLAAGTRVDGPTSRPELRRSCFPTLTSSGVLRPRVATELGVPLAVRGGTDLAAGASITDDLGLLPDTSVAAAGWAQLTEPWAGTFHATVRAGDPAGTVLGTLTTTTTPQVWETVTNGSTYHESLRLGSRALPPGWTLEVQQQAPGQTGWSRLTRTRTTSFELAPVTAAQVGTWQLRARTLRADGTASSDWSAVRTVVRRDVAP